MEVTHPVGNTLHMQQPSFLSQIPWNSLIQKTYSLAKTALSAAFIYGVYCNHPHAFTWTVIPSFCFFVFFPQCADEKLKLLSNTYNTFKSILFGPKVSRYKQAALVIITAFFLAHNFPNTVVVITFCSAIKVSRVFYNWLKSYELEFENISS